ncbi:MAG: Uma2 family endonuclease [Saprospiraceae bacterium]|jgi:Uma2 family endonuclease|nr:Uma2 family endonuclease [Saprospiraceae bacterium]
MGLPEKQYISAEQYLETERIALEKHEYYQGEIFAMSGASFRHNQIFKNTYIKLGMKLAGKPCQPYGSDLRIHIPSNTLYTYPDISIICGKPEMTDTIKDTITNPSVIIEILSKSTYDYDKGQKFTLYRDIESLKEYILIDSISVRVEHYSKNEDGSWTLKDYRTIDDKVIIETIASDLLLSDIYADVFEGEPEA